MAAWAAWSERGERPTDRSNPPVPTRRSVSPNSDEVVVLDRADVGQRELDKRLRSHTYSGGRDLNPEPVDKEKVFDGCCVSVWSKKHCVSKETVLSCVGLVLWCCRNMRPVRT